MKNAYRASTVLCAQWLVMVATLISPQVFAKPDFTGCEDLSGPGAGLCKAAAAKACDAGNADRACAKIAERFEKLTGGAAPWLDAQGPEIDCASPFDGAILDQAPGNLITFEGSVTDVSGLSELMVNGSPVTVDATGTFTSEITSVWGMNFVELSAADGAGNQTNRTCAFLLSDTWTPDDETLPSSISFTARQAAFDDRNRGDGLDSLADIFYTVINSPDLTDELNSTLVAANPLKPDECDVPAPLGVCLLSSRVQYLGAKTGALANPPMNSTTSMDLVAGGIQSSTRVDDIWINVRVDGKVGGIPYDTTGWIKYDWASVGLTSDTSLIGDRPNVSLRPGLVRVSIAPFETDFDGVDGAVIDILLALFKGPARYQVAGIVRDFVEENFNQVFDDVLETLDVHNLATHFDVPLLDHAGAVDVGFATNFSTFNVSSDRMLASLGTQFQTAPAHDRPTLGAPVPPGNGVLDIATAAPLAVAIHDGVVNQVLHALWRGGYFDANLAGGDLNGLVPPDVSLQLATTLPPTARLRDDGRLEIALGAVLGTLDHPGLFAQTVESSLSARGSCAPGLLGDDLRTENCLVEELHLSLGSEALDANSVASLELFLTDIVNQVFLTTVNDALPVLPIPGMLLPSSLGRYGLPSGSEMGLREAQLSIAGDHAVLEGTFGVR